MIFLFSYDKMGKLRDALDGKVVKNERHLNELIRALEMVFPEERFFQTVELLDSSDDDDDHNNNEHDSSAVSSQLTVDLPSPLKATTTNAPDHNKTSIAEYKTKTLKLKPAAAYAKPPNENRAKNYVTVPYKHPINQHAASSSKQLPQKKEYKPAPVKKLFNPENFDPQKAAFKLAGIKEKIYAKTYLKAGGSSVNDSVEEPETNPDEAQQDTSMDDLNENDTSMNDSNDTSMNSSHDQAESSQNDKSEPPKKNENKKAPRKVEAPRKAPKRRAAGILEDKNKKRRANHEAKEETSAKIAKLVKSKRPKRQIPKVHYAEPPINSREFESEKSSSDDDDDDFDQVPITKPQRARRSAKVAKIKMQAPKKEKAKAGARALKNKNGKK